ncbi:hypothetical protein VPHD148_0230 [Vibrio phage D148]
MLHAKPRPRLGFLVFATLLHLFSFSVYTIRQPNMEMVLYKYKESHVSV